MTRVINNQCTHLNVLHRVHFGDVWDKHMGQFRIKPVLQKWISHVYICNKKDVNKAKHNSPPSTRRIVVKKAAEPHQLVAKQEK